ncbi:hypothetical protein TNCV_3208021 [Trichonephila clavipes]|nr:hypothetical protein TNCV_3208021 [Trichonephila clavipes]
MGKKPSTTGRGARTSFFEHVPVMFLERCNMSFLVTSISLLDVPDRKYVLMWNDAFRVTGNVSKERTGPPKTVRTPESVERVRV